MLRWTDRRCEHAAIVTQRREPADEPRGGGGGGGGVAAIREEHRAARRAAPQDRRCLLGALVMQTNTFPDFKLVSVIFSLICNESDLIDTETEVLIASDFFQICSANKLLLLFRLSVMSGSLRPHGLQHARPPCPSPTPRVYSSSCPLSW